MMALKVFFENIYFLIIDPKEEVKKTAAPPISNEVNIEKKYDNLIKEKVNGVPVADGKAVAGKEASKKYY